ncbi:hypothetical protein [uncultured Pseudoxanthomonas sp.]|uniref:hypothetical protein n=1 Tax=uncultured Pseudoxanthomonas sp. TaxID=281701 RepID=UPI00262A0F3D|nr:hypothetical protein [uncultured Pseudoxanthomonas sp.]
MKELDACEVQMISGGAADFSNVVSGFSTSGNIQVVEEKTFLEKVSMLAPGMFR